MKRKFSIFLSSFILSIFFIIASSPFVSADEYITISSPYQKPDITDNSGYAELFVRYPNGLNGSIIIVWDAILSNSNVSTFVDIDVNDRAFAINVYSDEDVAGIVNYWIFESSGKYEYSSQLFSPGVYKQIVLTHVTILNYHCYGNTRYATIHPTFAGNNFNVVYGGEIEEINLLRQIVNQLGILQGGSGQIIQNQNENTDKILNFGSDKSQPDFGSTNGKLDDTVGQIESIEGSYQIDQAATNTALSTGTSFLQGSDMQRASIQVKTWIERFSSENRVFTGFLIAAMVLGLCFWVIGRKAWSK